MADKVTVKIEGLDNAIFDGINSSRELRREVSRFIDDIEAMAKVVWNTSAEGIPGNHPYQTGDYLAHFKKRKLTLRQKLFIKSTVAKGIPIGLVYNDSDVAHWVEFGTKADKPGSKSPFGPDTPTPAFKVFGRTAEIMGKDWRVG